MGDNEMASGIPLVLFLSRAFGFAHRGGEARVHEMGHDECMKWKMMIACFAKYTT